MIAALAVACPVCGVKRGQPCQRYRQAPSTPHRSHQERWQIAKRSLGTAPSNPRGEKGPHTPLNTTTQEAGDGGAAPSVRSLA